MDPQQPSFLADALYLLRFFVLLSNSEGPASTMAAVASNTNHVSFDKFDEKDVYIEYEKAFLDERTHNIVIDFDATEARAAKNLTSALLQDILQSQVSVPNSTYLCFPKLTS